MTDKLDYILSVMISAEREAAELVMRAHDILAQIKTGKRDVVTEYDKRVQALLIERLSAAVSGARFFCEEGDVHDALDAEDVFVIDPIDGTMNFVHSMHHSCISAAYMSRGELLAAAVYNPYTDELFTAIKGRGAKLGGAPIHVSCAPLSDSLFCFGSSPYRHELADETFRLARIAFDSALDLRRFASAELDLCMCAAGRAGLYFELETSFWDYAAGSLILTEAGGVCSAIDGSPLPLDGSKSSVAAGDRQAYEDFMELIK